LPIAQDPGPSDHEHHTDIFAHRLLDAIRISPEALEESVLARIIVVAIVSAWSCAIAACYCSNIRDEYQGAIVAIAVLSSTYASAVVLGQVPAMIVFWGIAGGLFLSRLLHKTCLSQSSECDRLDVEWTTMEDKTLFDAATCKKILQ
jgi:hypothetical protein